MIVLKRLKGGIQAFDALGRQAKGLAIFRPKKVKCGLIGCLRDVWERERVHGSLHLVKVKVKSKKVSPFFFKSKPLSQILTACYPHASAWRAS